MYVVSVLLFRGAASGAVSEGPAARGVAERREGAGDRARSAHGAPEG